MKIIASGVEPGRYGGLMHITLIVSSKCIGDDGLDTIAHL
jgi:hypothetical protein